MKKNTINQRVRYGIYLLLLTGLVGCASNTGPVVIRDSNTGSRVIVDKSQSSEDDKQPEQQKAQQGQNEERVKPVTPDVPASETALPIKQKLLEQSTQALANNQHKSAIAIAERGLRVDRKEPRFYQVLAAAYASLKDKKQSTFFAKQGLRYAKKGSSVYQSLQKWLR